ncbi:unnamed protein product [Caenorhabditis bovis]|uniref:Transcription initiation factor IIA subunit 2 n=1 Tax=Caenorhabditis bovis TaxID=2654633 RepID=A0A8S1EKL2_9PELO|nr:unnamed protein product [Caenorhabditis bovis]
MAAYALYRSTTLGQALEQTLTDMEEEGLIPKNLSAKVLNQFDKSMNKAISRIPREKIQFCAEKLITYRYCDNVWTFILNDIGIKDPHRSFDHPIDKLKIVACDGRQNVMLANTGLASGSQAPVKRNANDDDSD